MSPRTKEQNKEIKEQKRIVILESALKIFASEGFISTSIQSVASEAGISKGSIYTYFDSKINLLESILLEGISQFELLLDNYPKNSMSENDFENIIRGNFEILKTNTDYWSLYFNIITQPQARPLFNKIFAPFLDKYMNIFVEYFRSKNDENPEATALLLGSTLDGISLGYILMGEIYPIDDVLDKLIVKFK